MCCSPREKSPREKSPRENSLLGVRLFLSVRILWERIVYGWQQDLTVCRGTLPCQLPEGLGQIVDLLSEG